MADNVTLQSATPATPPAATVLATDDVSGVHYPRSKLDGGTDGVSTPILAGGGVEASALRVTIASDSTGVLSVDDNGGNLSVDDGGGSLTVDGTVAVSGTVPVSDASGSLTVDSPQLPAALAAGGGMKVEGVAGGVAVPVSAASLPLPSGAATAAKQPALGTAGTPSADVISVQGVAGGTAVPVSVASVPSHAVTNAGTFATQESGAALTALQLIDNIVLAEDAVHGSGDPGVQALAVRKDTGAALAGTDGDYSPLQVDASGNLRVNVVTGGGTGGTSATDDAAFTPASGSGTPIMGFADEVTPDVVDEGDVGVVRMTTYRGLHVNLRDASGNEVSVGGGTQYNEDDPEAGAGKVTMAGVIRRDTAASGVSLDGDVAYMCVDSTGKLHVNVGNTVTVGSHAVTNAGTFAVQAAQSGTWNVGTVTTVTTCSTVTTLTGGGVAHDGVDSGNPVKIGARALASPKGVTAVATADRTDLVADTDGILLVKLNTSGADAISEAVSDTGGTSTAFTNFGAVASTKNAVTAITAFRTDTGTTMAYIDFRDGTAGSVLYRLPLPPAGGATITLAGQPLFKTSANTALAYDVSAALTTVYISISGFQTKV